MNYTEALEYIHCGFFGGTRPGLSRISELLGRLGNPQNRLRFIHVAGTNGKGSFCAMTDSVLRRAGYRTGLYTSPYIEKFNERMVFDGEPISDEELAEIVSTVKPYAELMDDRPTEFELITAVAMLFFLRHGADPVVLEAGLGGRLDATNAVNTQVLSVITGISLDHTAILGGTTSKIAAEKAGILRPGVPLVWGGRDRYASRVIHRAAAEKGCPVVNAGRIKPVIKEFTLDGTSFVWDGFDAKLSLLGIYQPANAANVIAAVRLLRERGFRITDGDLREGLAAAKWKGRFELLCRDPVIISDGSHNPEGIAAAVEGIKRYFGGERVVLLTGVMKDKDWRGMAEELSPVASEVITLRPPNPRALAPSEFAAEFGRHGVPARGFEDVSLAVSAALTAAKSEGRPLVALGSLYMYGALIAALRAALGPALGG